MSLDTLKSRWSAVAPVFFDLYDQLEADHAEVLGMLAYTHDNRVARENPVQLDYLLHLPQAKAWMDDSIIEHGLDVLEWTIPLMGHDVISPINRLNIDRPNTQVTLEGIAQSQPEALLRRQIKMIMQVYRTNPLCVDGQNFFSTVHPKPGSSGEVYANILQPIFGVGALATPSLQVLANLIMQVLTRFGTILTLQAEVVDDGKLRQGLLVIVHNETHQTLFRELLTTDRLPEATLPDTTVVGERINPVKGLFKLWRDQRPTSGEENYIEFVMTTDANGPKPAVFVPDTDPQPIVLDESRVKNGFYGVGFQQIWGVKPFVPQTTIQAQPLEQAA